MRRGTTRGVRTHLQRDKVEVSSCASERSVPAERLLHLADRASTAAGQVVLHARYACAPPLTGIELPSSANELAPLQASRPEATQTTNEPPADPTEARTTPGDEKMPDPTCRPTTSAMPAREHASARWNTDTAEAGDGELDVVQLTRPGPELNVPFTRPTCFSGSPDPSSKPSSRVELSGMIIGSNAKSKPVIVSDRCVLSRGGGDDGGDSSRARSDDDDPRGDDSSCW